ncbi:MAG: cyclic nucleotide-binding domain-containing protein [Burkholderiales bacterium]
MEDLDFTQPAVRSDIYDPAVARTCFEPLGQPQSVAQGKPFFIEGQGSDRMYLLIEGEVGLLQKAKSIDVIKAGEIFGELAALTGQPRSASAMARTACRAISLDARQFQQAIQKTPEFALMMMSIIINRLRLTATMMKMTRTLPDARERDEVRVFDKRMLEELTGALRERPRQEVLPDRVIMEEGQGGVFMYVVLEGRVTITIQSTVVEKVGQGGVFGEMALVDQSRRAASAIADTRCLLLPLNRSDFLDLIRSKPGFAVSLLKGLADRLRFLTSQKT